jgi:oxygen-independent coproporphyrinogen-3 oxidase
LSQAPPVGVYIHWPYCARICPYCDFNVVRDRGQAEQAALAEALIADLAAQAAGIGERRLVSIFFGGGTPSLMDPARLAAVVEAARALWPAAPDLEVTLEANPTDAEADRFAAFAAGVTRLSLGLQSLDDTALGFLGRNHDAATAIRAARIARAVFPQLSLDLIYARPGQSLAAWNAEIDAALALDPDHLSPYQLTIEPGTAFDRAVRRGDFAPPGDDLAADLYETTQDRLESAGFEAYEVSNHARGPAARSRHNLAYWRGEDYLGVGPGAHGRVTLGGVRRARATHRKVGDYIAGVAERGTGLVEDDPLDRADAATERLLMGLRISEGVALAELGDQAPSPERIAGLTQAGLLVPDAGRLRATPDGRRLLDRLTLELLG